MSQVEYFSTERRNWLERFFALFSKRGEEIELPEDSLFARPWSVDTSTVAEVPDRVKAQIRIGVRVWNGSCWPRGISSTGSFQYGFAPATGAPVPPSLPERAPFGIETQIAWAARRTGARIPPELERTRGT